MNVTWVHVGRAAEEISRKQLMECLNDLLSSLVFILKAIKGFGEW